MGALHHIVVKVAARRGDARQRRRHRADSDVQERGRHQAGSREQRGATPGGLVATAALCLGLLPSVLEADLGAADGTPGDGGLTDVRADVTGFYSFHTADTTSAQGGGQQPN